MHGLLGSHRTFDCEVIALPGCVRKDASTDRSTPRWNCTIFWL
jgi:hypothetical protein